MRTDLPVVLTVPAVDLERARRFYELTLGLRLLQATRTEAWYETQCGAKFHLCPKTAQTESVAVAWEVCNIERLARQLAQYGSVVEERDDFTPEGSPASRKGPARLLRFRDTEGNLVSLFVSPLRGIRRGQFSPSSHTTLSYRR